MRYNSINGIKSGFTIFEKMSNNMKNNKSMDTEQQNDKKLHTVNRCVESPVIKISMRGRKTIKWIWYTVRLEKFISFTVKEIKKRWIGFFAGCKCHGGQET